MAALVALRGFVGAMADFVRSQRENGRVHARRAAVVWLLAAAAPTAGAALARPSAYVAFRTPSGNIGCAYSSAFAGQPAYLRCDIRSGLHHPTPGRPARCDLDYGDSVGLRRSGRASLVCHGDTVFSPHARVLAYGTSWRRDGFTCRSQAAGLRCSNLSGHGFFLSRERWSTF